MRERGVILAVQPVKHLDGQIDFNPARHVQKGAGLDRCLVQGGEFLRAKRRAVGHEMFAEKLRMLHDGLFQRHPDDPFGGECIREQFACD